MILLRKIIHKQISENERNIKIDVLKHVIWDVINKVASRTKSYTKFSVKSRHIGLREGLF